MSSVRSFGQIMIDLLPKFKEIFFLHANNPLEKEYPKINGKY